jgi:hypothetical protein
MPCQEELGVHYHVSSYIFTTPTRHSIQILIQRVLKTHSPSARCCCLMYWNGSCSIGHISNVVRLLFAVPIPVASVFSYKSCKGLCKVVQPCTTLRNLAQLRFKESCCELPISWKRHFGLLQTALRGAGDGMEIIHNQLWDRFEAPSRTSILTNVV